MEMTLSVFAAQTAFVEIMAQKGLKVKKETQEEVDKEDERVTWGSQGLQGILVRLGLQERKEARVRRVVVIIRRHMCQ